MVRRTNEAEVDPVDRDERLGEAIEAFLALAEAGQAPDFTAFASGYPGLEEDLIAALDGLALVQGLVGEPNGPGHRLESGRRVAGYRIVRELGRGGMGIVYEAVHVGLDRPVALKVLGSSAAPDSSGRRRFLNEARTAAGLHHTHIVPVFDVGQVGGLCYYAMQRIEGSGLDRVIKHLRRDRSVAAGSTYPGRQTPVPDLASLKIESIAPQLGDSTASWTSRSALGVGVARHEDDEPTPFEPPRGSAYYRWVATVGRQAAEALAHAHQRGVIHRDVKPSNLLVDARGVVWMADFGLARRLADPSQTQVDSLLGTPRYMSPEQAKTGPIDGRTDVYSLGATLYELLTLRPPFEGKTAAELIDQIATREPPSLRQFDPRIPRDLETIVLKAIQKRVVDRYETAAELADDLERFLNVEPVRARRIGPIGRAWRIARRHPSLTIVSATAIAVVITSSTIAYVRVIQERDEARKARGDAQDFALKLEAANHETRAALRSQLIQNATVVRMSAVADRRAGGLDLLKRAAALAPEPAQRTEIRDEAVAFLAIRDVEKRPEIPIVDRLHGLVFNDDGTHLATLSEDAGILRFWDVETRALIETHDLAAGLPARPGPSNRGGRGDAMPRMNPWRPWPRIAVTEGEVAAIVPDGKGIRLFDATTGMVSGNLRLYDHASPRVGPPSPDREIVGLLASADGRRIVTVDRPSDFDPMRPRMGGRLDFQMHYQVHLWDTQKPDHPIASLYEPRVETRNDPMARGSMPLVAISPDGSTIAVAEMMRDSEITLWSRDGKLRDTIDSQAQLTALALGPEGLLAAASNRAVHLWDLDQARVGTTGGTWLAALTPSLGFVDQLRFSRDDGTLLAVSGRGSGIELWDVSATARVATLPVAEEWHSMAMAPRSKMLAVGQPGALSFWAVVNPLARTQIAGFKMPVNTLAISKAGDLAMGSSRDGSLRLWSAGHCPASAKVVAPIHPTALAYDAQGRLITQERDRVSWLPSGTETPTLKIALPDSPRRGDARGNIALPTSPTIAQTRDGQTIVMTRLQDVLLGRLSPDGTSGKIVRLEMPDQADPATPDPGDRRPMSGGGRRGGAPPEGPPAPGDRGSRMGRGFWRDVAVSPSGDRVYLMSFPTDEFSAWSLQDRRLERLPWTVAGRFARMALSPDGATLALGDRSGMVVLVDVYTGQIRHRLAPSDGDPTAPVDSITFSPDGLELAVGTVGQIRLWSLRERIPFPLVRLPGHRGIVMSLAYSPDGNLLASGGEDKTVEVWDLERVRNKLGEFGLD